MHNALSGLRIEVKKTISFFHGFIKNVKASAGKGGVGAWFYSALGLFNDYGVQYSSA
jgi:hypothetical protein